MRLLIAYLNPLEQVSLVKFERVLNDIVGVLYPV